MTTADPEPITNADTQADVRASSAPEETLYAGPVSSPDEYELIGTGHKGGEGVVFQARYQGSLPRAVPFAVKQLIPPPGVSVGTWPDDKVVERWREQLKLLHLLHHQHLVAYQELLLGWPPHPKGTCSGEPPAELRTWYLVMERVEGPSLHDLVRAGDTDLAERMIYVNQLAEAVEYLHSGADSAGMTLLHRDIKPGNVIINKERGAVLVDYGLMRVEEPTLTELPAWTGPYLAPEVHADKTRTSRASDMWALGATAFFALTGRQPSPFDPMLMRRQLTDAVGHSEGVVAPMMEALEQAPDRRPSSPAAWATAVLREANKVTPPLTPTPAVPSAEVAGFGADQPPAFGEGVLSDGPRAPRWSRRSTLVSAVIAAVALVGAVGAFAALQLNNNSPHPGKIQTTNTAAGTTTTPPTTVAPLTPTTLVAPTTLPVIVPPVSPPTTVVPAAPTTVTGTVKDSSGAPVANAYVLGLNSLAVARTDASGRYSIPCKSEPLVAATWLLPVVSGPGAQTFGQNTTSYGPPPTTPGLGYAFSGGASDADHATVQGCGNAVDFVLRDGGNADIQILDASGAPVTGSNVPPDNLYLPGLSSHAALETAPVAADGHQLVDQLGGGVLRIDGTTSTLNCTGSGVTPDPSIAGATVTIAPGATVSVTCRES
jgi:serine/threonine protein kinase